MENAETGAHKNQRVRKAFEPTQHRVELPLQGKRVAILFNQIGNMLHIVSSQRVMDGFNEDRMLLVPGTGATMQLGEERGLGLLQATA